MYVPTVGHDPISEIFPTIERSIYFLRIASRLKIVLHLLIESKQYYTSGPAPTVQSTQESPKDMRYFGLPNPHFDFTYRYAYPPAVPQYDATNPYGSTYQSIPGYDYPRAPAPQVHRSDSSTASMYRRNLSVRSTEEGGDERPGRSHSSSRRSRERSIDPYQAVQTSGPDLSLSGHYASASGIAPAPMIVPSQRTAYPTNYSGTTSASAGPQIYASEYASTHSSYGGGNIPSTYDVSAVDPSSLYPLVPLEPARLLEPQQTLADLDRITEPGVVVLPSRQAKTSRVFGLFTLDQSPNVGTMAATDDNSLRLVIFFATSAKERAPQQNQPVHIVGRSSLGLRHEMVTCSMRSAGLVEGPMTSRLQVLFRCI
ncbi:MAG: hypothetical protein M1835_005492 [Candelina submexicana]|nr:MAG: hypothetical protein M1835_005492 [Candelina submexicana]